MEDEAVRANRARSIEQLAFRITEFAGHMNAATYHWLSMIAEFDRLRGWADNATQSCAHWLNWKCGIAMGAAREKVRVSRALESLPKMSAAMQRGELSYSNVRALTRVACEATEEYLLVIAKHGTAEHVERLVRGFRRCKEAEELSREAQQQANRYLRYRYAEDGSLVMEAQLPAEVGALFLKALTAALPEKPDSASPDFASRDVPAGTPVPRVPLAVRRADALELIAESFLRHGIESLNGGDRHQIVVHVDIDTLRERTAGRCELEEGPSMAAETARRLSCDASVVTLIENDQGEPLNVGRRTRSISPALRRALNARDQGCRFPDCCNTKVDAHHIHHWANGGETKPSNLTSLCHHHHRCVHEGGYQIQVLDDGGLRFIRPDGRAIDSVEHGHTAPLGNWEYLPAQNREHGLCMDRKTATARWGGESMDYGLAVEVLLQKARKGQRRRLNATNGKLAADWRGFPPDNPGLKRSSWEH